MIRLALALTMLGGCFTTRIGVGMSVTDKGTVAPQLTVGFGITSKQGGTVAAARIGVADQTTRTQAIAWQHHILFPQNLARDELPDRMIRLDGRLGMHEIWEDGPDRAFLFGGGAAYLWVIDGKDSCVIHGIGDQTRHAIGVETSVEGLAGGDPSLGNGVFTIGAVYQIDWYMRPSDCGS
jgi:hypothetical protein